MRTGREITACLLLALSAAVVQGCGKGTASQVQSVKAFTSAPAGVKAAWEAAVASARTNDYASAWLTLHDLRTVPGLPPEQIAAIDELSTKLNAHMDAAATKGDANARKALQDIRTAIQQARAGR